MTYKSFITTLMAAALALTSATAPAKADDTAKIIAGVATLAIIGAAIARNNSKDRGHVTRHHGHQPRHHVQRRHVQQHHYVQPRRHGHRQWAQGHNRGHRNWAHGNQRGQHRFYGHQNNRGHQGHNRR